MKDRYSSLIDIQGKDRQTNRQRQRDRQTKRNKERQPTPADAKARVPTCTTHLPDPELNNAEATERESGSRTSAYNLLFIILFICLSIFSYLSIDSFVLICLFRYLFYLYIYLFLGRGPAFLLFMYSLVFLSNVTFFPLDCPLFLLHSLCVTYSSIFLSYVFFLSFFFFSFHFLQPFLPLNVFSLSVVILSGALMGRGNYLA